MALWRPKNFGCGRFSHYLNFKQSTLERSVCHKEFTPCERETKTEAARVPEPQVLVHLVSWVFLDPVISGPLSYVPVIRIPGLISLSLRRHLEKP
jgi:hypothetical protein